MQHRAGILRLGFLAFAIAYAPAARAEEPTRAEALFREARQSLSAGNYAEACPKLEESQRLDPATGTLFNLARCYELTGRLASAWTAYIDVAEQTHAAGQLEREAKARERVAALQPRVSFLVVRLTEPLPAGIQLVLDGKDMPLAKTGVAAPIDPGEHAIRASAPGKRDWDARFRVEGDAQRVELVVAALEDAAVPATKAPEVAVATTAAVKAEGSGWGGQRATALGFFGAAVVAAGVGTYFGIEAFDLGNKARNAPNKTDFASARSDSLTAGNWSSGLFIGCGALAAAGGVLWFTAQKPGSAASTQLTPVLTPSSAGLLVTHPW